MRTFPLAVTLLLLLASVHVTMGAGEDGHWEYLGEDGAVWVPAHPPAVTALPPPGLGAFHDHAELSAALQGLAATYPSLATLTTLGNSVQGRALWSLTLRAHADDAKPWVLFDGAHHGDEVIASEILYRYAEQLVQEYPATARSRAILEHVNVVLVPMVNPDGVSLAHTATNYADARKNAHGVDLNRNYAGTWGLPGASGNPGDATYRGPSPASEPETQALQSLMASRNWTFYSSLHSGAEMVLWPLGWTTTPPAEEAMYDRLGDELTALTGAPNGQVSRILYAVSGDSMDHAMLAAGPHWKPVATSPETFEGSGNAFDWWPLFNPPDAQIPSVVARWTAFLDHLALEAAHYAPPALASPPAFEGPGAPFTLETEVTTPLKRPFLSGAASAQLPAFLSPTSPDPIPIGALNGTRALSWTLTPSSGGEGVVGLRVDAGVAGNMSASVPVRITAPAITLALDKARAQSGETVTATMRAWSDVPIAGTATLAWPGGTLDARNVSFAGGDEASWIVSWDVADAPSGPQAVTATLAYGDGVVSSTATIILDRPDVRLTRLVDTSVAPGEAFTMSVVAKNVGNQAAKGITLQERLPPGYALAPREVGVPVPADPLARPAPASTAVGPDGGLVLTWTVANLNPGAQHAYQLRLVPLIPGEHTLRAGGAYTSAAGYAYEAETLTAQTVGVP